MRALVILSICLVLVSTLTAAPTPTTAAPRPIVARNAPVPATPLRRTPPPMPTVAVMDPLAAALVNDKTQRDGNEQLIKSMIENLKATQEGFKTQKPANEQPDSARYMKELVHGLKGVRKSLTKQAPVQPGSSPEEMMLFQQLYSGLRKSARHPRERPAERPMDSSQMLALKNLMDQAHSLGDILESPEQTALHEHAHAQSRTLHRLSHVLEQMNLNADEDRSRRYDDMMGVLLHAHLSDPDYHDPLHDHLLAHHLSLSAHTPEDFDTHIANHLMYHDLGRHMEQDEDHGTDNPFMDLTDSFVPQAKPLKAPAAETKK